MKKILVLVSFLAVAAACAAPPTNEATPSTNTNLAASKPAATMTEAEAIAKEKSAWDAIKIKDYDAFASLLASDQVEVLGEGVHNKDQSVAGVKDFEPTELTFSNWKYLPIDKDAFVVTYTVAMKGKFKGKEFPPESDRASSAWVNRDGKWQAIYHQECTVKPPMTPAAASKNSPARAGASPAGTPAPIVTGPDPIANEKMVWDAFKTKNYDGFAELLAPEAVEVEPDNVYDRAGIIQGVKEFDASKAVLSDWKALNLDDDASLVVYMVKNPGSGPPDGARHATIWVKRGGKWIALFHHGGTPVTKPSAAAAPKMSPSPAMKASPPKM